jgi:hypothetical protein
MHGQTITGGASQFTVRVGRPMETLGVLKIVDWADAGAGAGAGAAAATVLVVVTGTV